LREIIGFVAGMKGFGVEIEIESSLEETGLVGGNM